MKSALLLVALASVFAQAGSSPFVGTWTAVIDGQPYVRLELTSTNNRISGRMALANIHFGNNGAVEAITRRLGSLAPISDVILRDGALSFARRDGDDIDRFEMKLANDQAALTFLLGNDLRAELATQGISAIQPFTLTRAAQ
jgi:hypothetical protein